MNGQGIATPLQAPVGGQENVPNALIRMLRENREALGAPWADMAIQFVEERSNFGRRKYGQELHTFDGRSPHLDALQELVDLMQYLHKAELEHASLVAENAGLRAKAGAMERERDASRENFMKAMRERDAAVAHAEGAEARALKAERMARREVAPDPDASSCDAIPDADCAARPRCVDGGGCPAFPKGFLLGRIS